MTDAYELARLVVDFVSNLRPGDHEWQKKRLAHIAELKKMKKSLDATIEHELEMLKIKFGQELIRERENQSRITRDYKEFLDSLDEMKERVKQTFVNMPPPMVFIIHNHARELLDDCWRNSDERAREICKTRLTDLMLIVYEDAQQAMIDKSDIKIPKKTLELIRGNKVTAP
jgi:hypothetical protein